MRLSNENMIHIKDGDIEYLQFKKLLEYKDRINHCITLRTGKLDFSSHGDFKNTVSTITDNYKRICDKLGTDYKRVVRSSQEHSDVVKRIYNKINPDKPDMDLEQLTPVDGLITDKKNIILATNAADCLILMMYDPVNNIIGNVHSGWKGTVSKIGQKAIIKMIGECGSNPKDLICCIGPHIGQCHFEVKTDVKDQIYEEFKNMEQIDKIFEQKNGSWYISLSLINRLILRHMGVLDENIIDSGICTVCNKDKFYSYRGDGKIDGVHTGLIELKTT